MFTLLLLTVAVVSQADNNDPPTPSTLAELIKTWDSKNTRVESARVEFYHLFLTRHEVRAISRKALNELVERLGDFADSDKREELAEAVCPESSLAARRNWRLQHAVKRGSEYSISGGGRFRSITSNYDIGVSLEQVDIYLPGVRKLYFFSFENLRTTLPAKILQRMELNAVEDGRVQVVYRAESLKVRIEATLDQSTGFVYEYREFDSSGSITAECWQFQPTLFGDGITYPLSRIDCKYSNDSVTWIDATFLDEASFNTPVADEEFYVPVEAGQTLVDRRKHKKVATIVEQHFDDAVVAADHYAALRIK